ncbi:porin family protein [Seonamhaeicola aphaedonensis]|uniref:Outer membrane protein with beta-barrel domain n=1 Tax=Seonamhaeicola aphaedonensis TaxID=1461338 RepID=A0A3D9HEP3_9FLAO|nr:tRNA modification GTPase [Seonamhaeicola aphaedonensis]RED47949.1 hypothetical protein DFQ02_105176 [Seonamhaeicola aphaedonensis]
MKALKQATILLILIFGIQAYSQSSLKKGYYIDNNNKKVSCFINDLDWLNNPTEFKYKLTENEQLKILSIESVKEFGIINSSKYVRFEVDIDKSSNSLKEMDYNKNPVFNEEVLFLKMLVEGKGNLYSYEDKGLRRYFFNKDNDDVVQLIHKSYLTNEGLVGYNNMFRNQLWNTLKCSNISMNQLSKLNYRESDLVNFFIKYNTCSNSEFINFNEKVKRDLFNLSIRPGLKSSALFIANENSRRNFDLGSGITSPRLGIEAEFILGFNNNKWAILLEPTYTNLKTEKTFVSKFTTGEEFLVEVNQQAIDVNLGIRYYLSTDKKLNVFANVLGTLNQSFNSSITVTSSIEGKSAENLEITSGGSVAIGVGCKHQAGYALELRYTPTYNILNGLGAWGSEFRYFSLIVGYSFF